MIVIRPHAGEVSAVTWASDGERLASVATDRRVMLWDADHLAAGRPRWECVGHPSEINHAQFSPNGTELYTCGTEGLVRVWDADDGRPLRETRPEDSPSPGASVNALVLSPDGQRLAWGGGRFFATADVLVGPSADLTPALRLRGHRGAIAIIAAHDGGWVTGGVDRTVRFWAAETGECVRTLPAEPDIVRGLSVNREGTLLAVVAGANASLRAFAPAGGGDPGAPVGVWPLRGHTGRIECVELSPDGTRVATAALDGTVRLWDVGTASPVRVFEPGVGPLHWVAFAPDRPTLAFSSHHGHVGLLDADA